MTQTKSGVFGEKVLPLWNQLCMVCEAEGIPIFLLAVNEVAVDIGNGNYDLADQMFMDCFVPLSAKLTADIALDTDGTFSGRELILEAAKNFFASLEPEQLTEVQDTSADDEAGDEGEAN